MNKHHPPFNGEPIPPHSRLSSTSYDAALSKDAKNSRDMLCRYIRRTYLQGETCDKCEVLFDLCHSDASARLGELEKEDLSSKWMQKIRLVVPRQLFTIDYKKGWDMRVVDKTRRKRWALVYFHLDHYDAVVRYYGVTRLWNPFNDD